MVQILFVDSDPDVHKLVQSMDWSKRHIRNCFCAQSVAEGRQMAQRYHPDIVVTELCLPDGYGLNMMDEILSFQPECRFILYTDQIYDEALIDAITLGCFRYLIKEPLLENMDNVLHAVDLLTPQIIEHMEREELNYQAKSQLKQLTQTAQQFCFNLLIAGGMPDDVDQAASLLRQYGLQLSAHAYSLCVCIFAPADGTAFENREELLCRSIELQMENSKKVKVFLTLNHEVCLLLSYADPPSYPQQKYMSETAKKHSQQYLDRYHFQPYSGFSPPVTSLSDIPRAFRIARSVARFAMLHGLLSVSFSELQIEENEYTVIWASIDYMLNRLRAGQSFASALEFIMYSLRSFNASVNFLQMIAVDCLVELQKNFPAVYAHWMSYQEDILQIKDLEAFHLFLNKRLLSLHSADTVSSESQHQWIIQQAKLYIQEHYAEKLTLAIVAKQIPISSSYLSSLFQIKGEMGFKDYLLMQRVEKAKELLESTQEKISNIAKQTGFTNVKYFSTCFKQKTGYTPSVFRSRFHKEREQPKAEPPIA